MIIVKLVGGLGNQMFQYAAGRRLARVNDTELKLDTSYLLDRKPRPNVIFRDFDLPIFDINAEVANPSEVARFTGGYSTAWRVYWHRLQSKISPPNIIKENNFHFDESILREKDNSYLIGYWQSEKYFKDIESTIRADFSFKEDILQRSQDLVASIRQTDSICLNVRRTDFVNLPSSMQILGFVGKEYYEKAVRFYKQKVNNPHFFIFSDDLDWCKENLQINDPVTFVEHTHAGKKFQNYLQLMTLCKNYIIPNSTFARWAAWLNKNPDKWVVAPKRWFADASVNNYDLLPEDWIKI